MLQVVTGKGDPGLAEATTLSASPCGGRIMLLRVRRLAGLLSAMLVCKTEEDFLS